MFLALLTAGLIRRYNIAADMYCYWFTHYYEAVAKWKEICSKQLAEIQRLKMIIAQMSED
ncbi:MAG: hypothetical protein LE169_05980 [Endomicrobium sp.]|nr:hypothetical protein [Endomicrobium sp.]